MGTGQRPLKGDAPPVMLLRSGCITKDAEFEEKGILLVLRGTSWWTMSQEGESSASTNRSCVWSLAGMEEETVWRIYMD